ncbi:MULTISPECIES: hypothetical protein [unclassified Candidatus Cardinium]|uniref:hypothetical protein n=1 Tax=unclassified Candidatus Cardinium TaxID=2641185 RepID=UPI001FB56D6B|nr:MULTISPECIES: hypothetical protein [unclassified Candidatus Cardinium]
MELLLCTSELAIKGIVILISWVLQWLYEYYKAVIIVNDAMSDNQLNKDELEDIKKVVNKRPSATSFSQLATAKTRLPEPASSVTQEPKLCFKQQRRKFFRNAFLMQVIMEQKGFTT